MNKIFPRISMLWLLVGIITLLFAFAAIFEIDQGVRAQGQVIPGSRTQVIQAVDGGMLVALHVREGDSVRAGQKLAEFEPDRAQAGYSQSQAEVASKTIALVRARAELIGRVPIYDEELSEWPEFIEAQMGVYRQRKLGLEQDVAVLQDGLRLASEELQMNRRLLQAGDISRSEVMRLERQVLDLRARINAARNKYFQDTRVEVAKLEDELSTSRHRLDERKNVLQHTDLISPMDGVVKYVRVTTVGGVLKPGDELMQISPVDDELILEIKVSPADVGQLRQGLPVSVRFDAFDSSIYGKANGTLRYISPDTLSEQANNGQTQTYYRALVALSWEKGVSTQRIRALRPQDIKPGMTATADVLTGQRSILSYLAKPITRAFSGALMER
jgi:adhesin transport system membrane fusion protein